MRTIREIELDILRVQSHIRTHGQAEWCIIIALIRRIDALRIERVAVYEAELKAKAKAEGR